MKMYDYINRVVITLPLTVYEGTWTTLSALVAMHHHDRSCVCVGIFLKLLRSPTVPTKPMVKEPPKIYHTTEAFYLDHLRSICARAENPTNLVEGKSLNEHLIFCDTAYLKKGNFCGIILIVCIAMP